jgi:hypothetical protein
MADVPDNILLEYLRHIRSAVDGLREDMRAVKGRLSAVELGLAAIRREVAGLAEADAHLGIRIDRLSDPTERIEKRLDLVPSG